MQVKCVWVLLFMWNFVREVVGRDCIVGIASVYGLGGPGIDFPSGARFSAPVLTGYMASHFLG
jgi:hypothetical protein